MDKDKLKDIEDEEKKLRNSIVRQLAMTIEISFESFGIICKVVEYNFRPNDIEFCLELALGTPLEKVIKHHKDIAMAVSSPTGDVEIEAPIPGRSLFAVRIPVRTGWMKSQYEYQKQLGADTKKMTEEVKLENEEESSGPKTFLDYLSLPFLLAATIFEITSEYLRKLGNFINGRLK
ncbi:MAG: DNA translocase FtsK [Candidatus Shapirobacteria bacterium]|jgi:S-DNA-T family DNA segregation ATPase FtsK/SpoIIIE